MTERSMYEGPLQRALGSAGPEQEATGRKWPARLQRIGAAIFGISAGSEAFLMIADIDSTAAAVGSLGGMAVGAATTLFGIGAETVQSWDEA